MARSEGKRTIRLNRYLAQGGLCSRREADRFIEEGRVQVNGRRVYELGIQIDPVEDSVKVDGKLLRQDQPRVYYMFHKPKNVMTTLSDPEGRPCIADYTRSLGVRVYPVGRLDWASEGLLLLTNDGDFANKVMHPKHAVTKTYLVKIDGNPTEAQLEKLRKGISIVGGKVRAKAVSLAQVGESDQYKWVRIIITEGKNQQVRKMFEKIGFDVLRLRRVAVGQLSLASLKVGDMKPLGLKQTALIFQEDDISLRVKRAAEKTKGVKKSSNKTSSYRTTSYKKKTFKK
jgi:23S rRNA pseudouridine2605 synthase